MKKLCSILLTLVTCLMLTVPALAAETGVAAVAEANSDTGAYGYVVTPWSSAYTFTAGPWTANASYVVRPWESNRPGYAMSVNGTAALAPHTNYIYDTIWRNKTESLNNFQRFRTYTAKTYKDVPSGAWYEQGVRTLYECGLLGDSEKFGPRAALTLGDVVSMAVRVHSIYHNWSIPADMSDLQYALNVGIVTAGQYDNYNDLATRRSFAAIMSKAVPASALKGINAILDGAIPDVPMSDPGSWGIYTLYRAGVLAGNNAWGTFAPNDGITRDSAAVITARIIDPAQRQRTNLVTVVQPVSVSVSQSSLSLYPGESRTLVSYVYPATAANQIVRWASSDYGVASVDAYGTVTCYRPGTAVITATTAAGTTASCTVMVSNWY